MIASPTAGTSSGDELIHSQSTPSPNEDKQCSGRNVATRTVIQLCDQRLILSYSIIFSNHDDRTQTVVTLVEK